VAGGADLVGVEPGKLCWGLACQGPDHPRLKVRYDALRGYHGHRHAGGALCLASLAMDYMTPLRVLAMVSNTLLITYAR
jgi:hypothetical protein